VYAIAMLMFVLQITLTLGALTADGRTRWQLPGWQRPTSGPQVEAEQLAHNFAIYRDSLVRFLRQGGLPVAGTEVLERDLVGFFPAGYTAARAWRNVIQPPNVIVYLDTPTVPNIVTEISRLDAGPNANSDDPGMAGAVFVDPTTGVFRLLSPNAGTTTFVLNGLQPGTLRGSPVWMTRVP
jgi:hypothetical protein